jgi:hypothetical protein
VPTSDEELLEKQRSVEEKRATLADLQADRERNERALDNDIAAAALDAEAARLDAEIAEAEKRGTPEAAEAGNASNLGNAREQMEAAIERKRVAEAPVPEPVTDKVYTYDNPPLEVVEANAKAAAEAEIAAGASLPEPTVPPNAPTPAPSSPFVSTPVEPTVSDDDEREV